MRPSHALTAMFALAAFVVAPFAHAANPIEIGDLVKCQNFSSVYLIGEDGERHVFPNEHMYFSWYRDFNDVKTIACDDLASFTLGENVVYQPGTRLIKIPSVPTVYAVEDNGRLRAIQSEDQARELFGDQWAQRVDDLPESFFPSFELGTELEDGEVPEGTILTDEDGNLFRMESGEAVEIDSLLSTDQEDVLDDHAVNIDDIEDRLGVALALLRVDAEHALDILRGVLEKLQAINVDDADEVDDIHDVEEIEDAEDAKDDAEDAIEDARDAIEDALEDASESDLTDANEHLNMAEAAMEAKNYATAEMHAEEAEDAADLIRGKMDDDDLAEAEEEDESEDEDEHEDVDDDSSEREDESEVEDGNDNDD